MSRRFNILMAPFLLLGLAALVAGVCGGLIRMGLLVPAHVAYLAAYHGPLMVGGFLGTLITLERAVAIEKKIVFILPLLTGFGAVLFWLAADPFIGLNMILLSSLGFVFLYGYLIYRQPSIHMTVMGLGSLLWFLGNVLWRNGTAFGYIADFWAGFLILTVVGERIELSRFILQGKKERILIIIIVSAYVSGLSLSVFWLKPGIYTAAISLLMMALWLLKYDLARVTIKTQGLTRFMAACLLTGYVWLIISSGFMIVYLYNPMHLVYDAMLHSIFLGFIFSMIFAHAPVIFTSITGIEMEYREIFYIHYAVLHISLVIRIFGDLSGSASIRLLGGILNGIAILIFIINTAIAVWSAKRQTVTEMNKQ